jgi:hypothetical protein
MLQTIYQGLNLFSFLYRDGITKTYGDPYQCQNEWPTVEHDPSVDINGIIPIEIEHVY